MLWVLELFLFLGGLFSSRIHERGPGRDRRPIVSEKLHYLETTPTSTELPDYFDSTRGHFLGPTATGEAPFLAQNNPAPFTSVPYVPNAPLETHVPIKGNKHNGNIFQLMGILSPYFPNPKGFGVDEYPIPQGSNITWVNMVHRHGSRYPELEGSKTAEVNLGWKVHNASGKFEAHGELSFLNTWKYALGGEILVPFGKQELFNSGTLHYYQYGQLYPNNGSKIIVRTTTQKRMLQSAEYFMSGFFGLDWTQNATLEVIVENSGFNNTLAGAHICNNSKTMATGPAYAAMFQWVSLYLADAHERIGSQISGDLDWTLNDTFAAQSLCAFETVSLGFSHWCDLFTYDEWEGYEYAWDIAFSATNGFHSAVGRAIGVGYVQEVLARMEQHTLDTPRAQINTTLTNNTVTFPLTSALNFDFSHDSTILSILVAFGLRQFSEDLPLTHIKKHREFVLSHLTPFASRLVIEIIKTPHPVNPSRKSKKVYLEGEETSYVHFVLNQRTIPLGRSLKECGKRDDGWCELSTFLKVQKKQVELADFEYACFGNYSVPQYGDITDGRPLKHGS